MWSRFARPPLVYCLGTAGLYPEGMIGLSRGFQPQVLRELTSRPKVAVELRLLQPALDQKSYAAFRARRDVGVFLGLKPQAESYYPFEINPTAPSRHDLHICTQNRFHIPRKSFEDEDDDEDEDDFEKSSHRLLAPGSSNCLLLTAY